MSSGGTPGRRQLFDHGALYGWDDGTVVPVVGSMHEVHERLGGVAGQFGFPIGAVTSDDVQEFEGGAIVVARPYVREADPPSHPVVAAGSIRSGHQEQFVALPDGKIHRRWHYGGGWSNWALFDTGGTPVRLAVMSSREGAWGVCLTRGSEHAIRLRWFQDGQWSAWEAVATPRPVSSIAAASFAPGHQEVFVALDDGTLYNRWKGGDGGWSSWTWFEAPAPVRRVAYGSAQPGSLELYALDVNGVLHGRTFRQGDAWSDWTSISLDGEFVAIAYGVRRDGHREMFAALADGRVVHQWWQRDGWSDWYEFGSVEPIVDLAVAHQSGRELEVFAITVSGGLVHRWYRPGLDEWSPWEVIELPSTWAPEKCRCPARG